MRPNARRTPVECPPATRRAFTLIEAIIAIVVLSVAIPGMLWTMREAAGKHSDPVLASRARWLAAEKLEDVIADRHSPSRLYVYSVNANYAAEANVTGFTNFARSVSIVESGANLVAASGTGYKTVTVSVTYKDGRNVSRTVQMKTVITDYTP